MPDAVQSRGTSARLAALLASLAALWAIFQRLRSQRPRNSAASSGSKVAEESVEEAHGGQEASEAASGHEQKAPELEPEPAPEEAPGEVARGGPGSHILPTAQAPAEVVREGPAPSRRAPSEDPCAVAKSLARAEAQASKAYEEPVLRDCISALVQLHARSREAVESGLGVETSYVPNRCGQQERLVLLRFSTLGLLGFMEVIGLLCLVLAVKTGFAANLGILLMCILMGGACVILPFKGTRQATSGAADALHAVAEVRTPAVPHVWKEVAAWAARAPPECLRGVSWDSDVAFLVEAAASEGSSQYQAFVVESLPLRVHHYIVRPDATSASASEAAWGLRAFLARAEAGDGIIEEDIHPSGIERTASKRKYKKVRVIFSQRDANRLEELPSLELKDGGAGPSQWPCVFVSPKNRMAKKWLGFGGSFTEASATVFAQMTPEHQEEVLHAYFHPVAGAGYTLGRMSMGSCDFGLGNWTCGELADEDHSLTNFSIEHYAKEILPLYHRSAEIAGAPISILASPWTAPPWMKTKRSFTGDGHLRRDCGEAWAQHFVRFVQEMRQARVQIMAVSVQNEPEAQTPWECCIYTPEEERDFVKYHLGPALEEAGLSDVKVLVWDHNRDGMFERAQIPYADPEAAKYIWGCAYHWYGDARFEVWPDRSEVHFADRQREWKDYFQLAARLGLNNVRRVAELQPDKHILFTEGCQELGGIPLEAVRDWWLYGERYAMNIIADVNNGTEGWIDWNLILNEHGGPNHVGNNCIAPIIYDTQKKEVIYTAPYFAVSHFSRFIRPGARRVLCSTSRDALEVTSFANPDDSIVVVVLNQTSSEIDFQLKVAGEGTEPMQTAGVRSPPSSILTLVLE